MWWEVPSPARQTRSYTARRPEIAVASTKAYTTQLLVMYLLALYLAEVRGTMNRAELKACTVSCCISIPWLTRCLPREAKIKQLAQKYAHVQSTFFLGRGFDYAVAMEGALKLKEVSYIHAEAYAAGELKHGPLALIESGVPVMALITQDHLVDKTMSNLREVKARGAVVVAICKATCRRPPEECDEQILLPDINPLLAPIVGVILCRSLPIIWR